MDHDSASPCVIMNRLIAIGLVEDVLGRAIVDANIVSFAQIERLIEILLNSILRRRKQIDGVVRGVVEQRLVDQPGLFVAVGESITPLQNTNSRDHRIPLRTRRHDLFNRGRHVNLVGIDAVGVGFAKFEHTAAPGKTPSFVGFRQKAKLDLRDGHVICPPFCFVEEIIISPWHMKAGRITLLAMNRPVPASRLVLPQIPG